MSCHFMGVEMTDSSNETNVAGFLGHTCHYLKMEFSGSFLVSLQGAGRAEMISLLLLTQQARHEFGNNLVHVHTICQSALN